MVLTPRIQIVVLVILGQILVAEFLAAQNPLRADHPPVISHSAPGQSADSQNPATADSPVYSNSNQPLSAPAPTNAKSIDWLQARRQDTPPRDDHAPQPNANALNPDRRHPENFRADKYLRQASFDDSLESGDSVAREIVLAGNSNPSLLGKSLLPGDQDLGEMISQITINSCFVLAIAIGFILLARQWFFRGTKTVRPGGNRTGLCVKEILKIDSRITLRLIQCRSTDILVASDTTGIKSVSVLNTGFEEKLDEQSESDLLHQIISSLTEKESKTLKTS